MTTSLRIRREPAPVRSRWSALSGLAAVAAALSAVLIPVQVAVFLIWPPPLNGGIVDWYALLRENRIAGLVDLDLLLVVDNILLLPILLALFVRLRAIRESTMVIATAMGLLGIVAYVVTNPAVQMAALSDEYATADQAGRASAVAAGQAVLAVWQGTAFHVGYLAGSLAGILTGVVMLRSPLFGRFTAWMMILANAIGLGLYAPGIGVYIAVFSVVFLEIWYLRLARTLWRAAKTDQLRLTHL